MGGEITIVLCCTVCELAWLWCCECVRWCVDVGRVCDVTTLHSAGRTVTGGVSWRIIVIGDALCRSMCCTRCVSGTWLNTTPGKPGISVRTCDPADMTVTGESESCTVTGVSWPPCRTWPPCSTVTASAAS